MERGEVWIVDFEPTRGSEANKRHPAVIVSNNPANRSVSNRGRGLVTVVPLSTNTALVHHFQTFVPRSASGLRADSKAQAEQIRAIDVERFLTRVGHLPPAVMDLVDEAMRVQLAL